MKIYSFPTFNLTKIILTAEEIGQPYELTLLDLSKAEHKSEEHLARSPLGKVPTIELNGQHYFESNAICRLISERNNFALLGNTPEERAIVNQWLDMTTLHVGRWLTTMFVEQTVKPKILNIAPSVNNIDEAETFLSQQLPIIEKQLAENNFLAGSSYSLADIVAYSYFSTVPYSKVDLSPYPRIQNWITSVESRTSFKDAMAKLPGGSIFAALNN